MMRRIKKYLITGLLFTLPVVLSVYLFWSTFLFFDNILGKYIRKIFGVYVPGIGLIISVLMIVLVGFIASHFLGRRLKILFENVVLRIPLLSKIYPITNDIVRFFFSEENRIKFNRVVLLQYPSQGIWSLGFVTNEGWDEVNKTVGSELAVVFIPSLPNPISGFCVFVPKREVLILDVSVEDALKFIISDGVFIPKKKS